MTIMMRPMAVLPCAIWLCGCHSKNLGVMEWDLLDKAVPQGYIIAEPPAEAFRALRQAVADTPQARLLVSDESSGLITWFIRGETKEEQKARKRKTLGEPVLTVGSARRASAH